MTLLFNKEFVIPIDDVICLMRRNSAARRFTEQALELSQNATRVYPQLAEAFYHHAKFAALPDNAETTVNLFVEHAQ